MGRSQRSKNYNKNIKNSNKRSENYKTKSELKKERKELKKHSQMEKKFLIGLYDNYREGGKLNTSLYRTTCKLVGVYSTEPIYTMYDLNKDEQCVLKSSGDNSIKIEVWEVSQLEITKLEGEYYYYPEFEEQSQDYTKQKVISPFGEMILYLYTLECDEKEIVISGDWIEHLNYKRVVGNKLIIT